MGERLVRAMAVSTSISTLARVPSTISMMIGSTVVPSAVSRLPCSYAVGRPAGLAGFAATIAARSAAVAAPSAGDWAGWAVVVLMALRPPS